MENEQPAEPSRKNPKRKRDIKSKGEKKLKEEVNEVSSLNMEYENRAATNRWKIKALKQKCFLAFVLVIVSGLLVSNLQTIRF